MLKTALITGGTSGIGLATAIAFLKAGLSVAVCGRDADRREAARSMLAECVADSPLDSRPNFHVLCCDLQEPGQCTGLIQSAAEVLGPIDILVNNAAVAPLSAFQETTEKDFDQVLSVNLRATWMLTQQLWTSMSARRQGVIVNISSMAAIYPFTGFSLYGASKGWLETWTKALADEGSRKGIRVYGIRPGAVETPMLRKLFPDYPADQCVLPQRVADTILDLVLHEVLPPGSIVTVAKQGDVDHSDGP